MREDQDGSCILTLEEAYDYAGEVMAKNMMAADAREGINAFIERRPANWSDRG